MDGVIFELTETSYVEAVWYVAWTDKDWMAMVYRDTPEAPWRATYRFRYYRDSEAFQSDDEKSIYDVKGTNASDDTRARLCGGFDRVMAEMRKDPGVQNARKNGHPRRQRSLHEAVHESILGTCESHAEDADGPAVNCYTSGCG